MEVSVGYQFVPTDEELVLDYLFNKAFGKPLPAKMIQEIAASKLFEKPPKSLVTWSCGEKECYFFIHDDENIPSESEIIRIVGNGIGFWKSGGEEKPISDVKGFVLAFKKHLIYFSGSFSEAKKTHWKMELYRLTTEFYTNFKGKNWELGRMRRGMDYSTTSCF
ncbi:hypothetical protein Pint_16219 [Pistacia integerrima]|uniref:Uncharacterized protein n=1 Tax=Pistacia integerrima TaxID=434235 RepID=A0ACC0Z903_9ROSI|nr:hypothetical protein Pint_16219 [Pistacia integerrima]